MTYELEFKESALKEWRKLDNSIRELFKKRLAERLPSPRVESACLTGLPDYYKIKLRNAGYRLVYQVCDNLVLVTVGHCRRQTGKQSGISQRQGTSLICTVTPNICDADVFKTELAGETFTEDADL